jgi:hypothetical protein
MMSSCSRGLDSIIRFTCMCASEALMPSSEPDKRSPRASDRNRAATGESISLNASAMSSAHRRVKYCRRRRPEFTNQSSPGVRGKSRQTPRAPAARRFAAKRAGRLAARVGLREVG